MKAMVIKRPGPPEALRLLEWPDPTPNEHEVLIDVAYAGVGFVDTLFRAGVFPLPMPLVPGIEVAGHVRAVGGGTSDLKPGQAVVAMLNDFGRGPRAGGYAELAVAHASMTTPVAEAADLARLAGVIVNGVTAWLALHDLAQVRPSDRVVVLGASGGLGGIACRLAAIAPARQVIGVVGSERTRSLAPPECTDVVVAAEFEAAIDELTGGAGVDVVIDPVGGTLRRLAFAVLAPFGRLLVLGNASGEDRAVSTDDVWLGSRQVQGLSLGAVAHRIPDRVAAASAAVVALLARGALREPEPAVQPLEAAADVHRMLERRAAPPKTVLAVRSAGLD